MWLMIHSIIVHSGGILKIHKAQGKSIVGERAFSALDNAR